MLQMANDECGHEDSSIYYQLRYESHETPCKMGATCMRMCVLYEQNTKRKDTPEMTLVPFRGRNCKGTLTWCDRTNNYYRP